MRKETTLPEENRTVAGGEGPGTLETRADVFLQQMLTLQLCVLDNSPPLNSLRYSKDEGQELAQVGAQGPHSRRKRAHLGCVDWDMNWAVTQHLCVYQRLWMRPRSHQNGACTAGVGLSNSSN